MKMKHPVAASDDSLAGHGVLQLDRLRARRAALAAPCTRLFQITSIFGIGEQPLLQNLRGPELVAPVDDIHLLGVAGEIVGLLHGGVAAADHGDGLALEEGSVAHRAVGDSPAGVLQLARHLQLGGRAARGEDHRGRLVDRCPTVVATSNMPSSRRTMRFDVLLPDVGPELRARGRSSSRPARRPRTCSKPG